MQLIGRVTGPPATDKGGPHKIAQVTASLSVISTLYTIPISLSLNHNLPSPSCRQYDPPKALTTRARGGNQRRIQCGHIYLEIYVRTMSALCPHDISRRIYVSLAREMLCGHCADIVPTLCGHISQGIYVRTMSALYPSSVFSSGKIQLSPVLHIGIIAHAVV